MRPLLGLSALFALTFALAGCLTRGDSLAPIITITNPTSGAVRTAENLTVTGYVLDDDGVAAIRVRVPGGGEQDLLADPVYASERGKRLVQFQFRLGGAITDGRWQAHITAEDVSGRLSTLDYELEIDTTPPTLELNELEALPGNRLRVSGVARDNLQLASVTINDISLPVGQVSERYFTLDVPEADTVTVVARDEAGNTTRRQLSP